tara:strand:- start:134 stop:907 length:774 start_codon:yes stop_codon:yes gene_type:complete
MSSFYANKINDINVEDCYFYHTMELPDFGVVYGEWDLRKNLNKYLGNVDFSNNSVLDVGCANGFISFQIEKQSSRVLAYDLSPEQEWDIVPYHNINLEQHIQERKKHIEKINNGFWLAHKAFSSDVKMIYGSIYNINSEIGQFDIGILGSILLHLRDPFLALQEVSKHIKKKIIITDIVRKYRGKLPALIELFPSINIMRFLPHISNNNQHDTWWELSPKLVSNFIKILGFENIQVTHHYQIYKGKKIKLYTVVGER